MPISCFFGSFRGLWNFFSVARTHYTVFSWRFSTNIARLNIIVFTTSNTYDRCLCVCVCVLVSSEQDQGLDQLSQALRRQREVGLVIQDEVVDQNCKIV